MNTAPPVTLRRLDPALNMARFYVIRIESTLFGQWAVIRQWGRQGGAGQTRELWFDDLASALAEQAVWDRRKRRRGYCADETGLSRSDCNHIDDVYTNV